MRVTLAVWLVVLLAMTSGCGSRQEPVVVGKLESGTFWKSPLTSGSNEGHDYDKGSRVEIYDQFIVITTPDGTSNLHPHGNYSNFRFKKD